MTLSRGWNHVISKRGVLKNTSRAQLVPSSLVNCTYFYSLHIMVIFTLLQWWATQGDVSRLCLHTSSALQALVACVYRRRRVLDRVSGPLQWHLSLRARASIRFCRLFLSPAQETFRFYGPLHCRRPLFTTSLPRLPHTSTSPSLTRREHLRDESRTPLNPRQYYPAEGRIRNRTAGVACSTGRARIATCVANSTGRSVCKRGAGGIVLCLDIGCFRYGTNREWYTPWTR